MYVGAVGGILTQAPDGESTECRSLEHPSCQLAALASAPHLDDCVWSSNRFTAATVILLSDKAFPHWQNRIAYFRLTTEISAFCAASMLRTS